MSGVFKGLCVATAIGSLAGLSWLGLRQPRTAAFRKLVRLTLRLNLSLLLLFVLLSGLYEALRDASDHKVIVAACVVFVALLWDILVSGHSITNPDGKLFPRRARVLLFFSYVSLAAGSVLFGATAQRATQLEYAAFIARLYSDSDRLVEQGIAEYGAALLIALFLLRAGPVFLQVMRSERPERQAGALAQPLDAAQA